MKNNLLLAEEQLKEKKKEIIHLQRDTEKQINLMQIDLKAAINKAKEHESDKHIVSDSPSVSVALCLSLSLSHFLSLSLSVSLFLSVCLCLSLSVSVSLSLLCLCLSSVSLFSSVCLSSVCRLSVYLSVCLSVCLSLSLSHTHSQKFPFCWHPFFVCKWWQWWFVLMGQSWSCSLITLHPVHRGWLIGLPCVEGVDKMTASTGASWAMKSLSSIESLCQQHAVSLLEAVIVQLMLKMIEMLSKMWWFPMNWWLMVICSAHFWSSMSFRFTLKHIFT